MFALLLGEFGVQHQIGHAQDSVHRRPDFMAHGRQECALRLICYFCRFLRVVQVLFESLALAEIPHECGKLVHSIQPHRGNGDLRGNSAPVAAGNCNFKSLMLAGNLALRQQLPDFLLVIVTL